MIFEPHLFQYVIWNAIVASDKFIQPLTDQELVIADYMYQPFRNIHIVIRK